VKDADSSKKPAVFLDRDGVINVERSYISSPGELVLIPRSAGAIRRLNDVGWPVVVISNQSAVARGLCDEEGLAVIHRRLEEMLQEAAGARLDGIYYCPHHPEAYHPGGDLRYRIECSCRKPKTGLIDQAAAELSLDVARSYLVGDSMRDVLTGNNCGATAILVATGYAGRDGTVEARPDLEVADLWEAVESILGREGRRARPGGMRD
jgi:histidinol-phosphate phosphatase family protein